MVMLLAIHIFLKVSILLMLNDKCNMRCYRFLKNPFCAVTYESASILWLIHHVFIGKENWRAINVKLPAQNAKFTVRNKPKLTARELY